jgi:hypothetical protein
MSSVITPSFPVGSNTDENDPPNEDTSELQYLFEDHAVGEVAELLGDYLGIGIDAISLMMFISRAAGRLGNPINLAIYSDDPGAVGNGSKWRRGAVEFGGAGLGTPSLQGNSRG